MVIFQEQLLDLNSAVNQIMFLPTTNTYNIDLLVGNLIIFKKIKQ